MTVYIKLSTFILGLCVFLLLVVVSSANSQAELCALAFNTACLLNPIEAFCTCSGDAATSINCNIKSGVTLKQQSLYDTFCLPYSDKSQQTGSIEVCTDINTCTPFDRTRTADQLFSYGTVRNCTSGYQCKESTDPPLICGGKNDKNGTAEYGFYCRLPTTQTKCEDGDFCPMGATGPESCGAVTSCTLGSTRRIQILPLLIALLIVLLSALAYLILKHYERMLIDLYVKETMFMRGFGEEPPTCFKALKKNIDIRLEDVSLDITVKTKSNLLFGKTVENSKRVLTQINAHFKCGEATAILGPFGAGKSSLVSVLTGCVPFTEGKIYVNDEEADPKEFKSYIGFVPHENEYIEELSIEEILKLSALIRLPKSWTKGEKHKHLNAVLKVLRLDSIQKSPVCDEAITEGQKKLVNIGVELVSNPGVVIVDEPMLGLDAQTSHEVAEIIKEIANLGRTVVAVVHQPKYEAYKLFDNVILLAKDGQVGYQGPPLAILEYLELKGFVCPEMSNPSDFVLDVVNCRVKLPSGEVPEIPFLSSEWRNYCKENSSTIFKSNRMAGTDGLEGNEEVKETAFVTEASGEGQGAGAAPEKVHDVEGEPSFEPINILEVQEDGDESPDVNVVTKEKFPYFRQFFFFLQRSLFQYYRRPRFILVLLAIHTVAALVVGLVFSQEEYLYLPPLREFVAKFCPPYLESRCNERPIHSDSLQAFVFFVPLTVGIATTVSSYHTFADDIKVYYREARAGESRLMYFLAKNVSDLPLVFFGGLIFTSLIVVSTRPIMHFSALLGVLFFVELVGYGIGYFISIVFSKENSYIFGIMLSFLFCVANGISPRLKVVEQDYYPLNVLWAISFGRYAAEALYISETEYYEGSFPVEKDLSYIGYDSGNYGFDLGLLLVLALGWRIVSFIALITTNKHLQTQ
eukprot:Nk52_evm15s1401 gene=Nk52_evmTU15s1401